MEGYTRDNHTTVQLLKAVTEALIRTPNERLGQLLVNVTRDTDLFNIHDEDLVTKLYAYVENL